MTLRTADIVRLRLAQQRLVGAPFAQPEDAVRWFGAVQAQDYAGAKWALALRTAGLTSAEIEQRFNAGTILRTHVLRPTWHFVVPEDLRWLLKLTSPQVKARMAPHDRMLKLTPRVFGRSQELMAAALRGGSHRTRDELASALARGGIVATGQRLGHLVMRAELDALICSGPRRGKQFTYALVEERVPAAPEKSRDEALAELARRYFGSHGPATLQDFVWWSGLSMTDVKGAVALAGSQLEMTKSDDRTLWATPVAVGRKTPAIQLLPNFDEYLVGFRDRRDALDPKLADRVDAKDRGFAALLANVILRDGRVVGTWQRTLSRTSVVVETSPMVRLTAAECAALARAVERFGRFLEMPVQLREESAEKKRPLVHQTTVRASGNRDQRRHGRDG